VTRDLPRYADLSRDLPRDLPRFASPVVGRGPIQGFVFHLFVLLFLFVFAQFRRLFSERGTLETYRRDEIVLFERDKPDALLLVVQGSVQGVVHETYSRHYHPLGCVAPYPSRSRHRSGILTYPEVS
jgi:hypothetical protein